MSIKHDVINLDSKKVGTIELKKEIFSLPIRKDILKNVVDWQLSNRRKGQHKVKQRSEVTGTTAKAFKQKGTGKNFLESDFKPEHLRVIYDQFNDQMVDEFLQNF